MKSLKKLLVTVVCGALFCTYLVGCSATTSLSATFNVDTGDSVKVTYDTTNSDNSFYFEDGNFYIGHKGETPVVSGCFAHEEAWDYYTTAVSVDETASVISIDETSNHECLVYSVDSEVGVQYVKILHIPNSSTYVVLVTLEGEDVLFAEADRLNFETK